MSVIGIDPGIGGALATYDPATGALDVVDTPSWQEKKGKGTRKRLDIPSIIEYFEWAKLTGVDLVVIEGVGGRPQQTQSSGYTLGYTVGVLVTAAKAAKLRVESVDAKDWKKTMQVPGKVARFTKEEKAAWGDDAAAEKAARKQRGDAQVSTIIHRADTFFPSHTHVWRGPRGGFRLDRAEAAMIAMYGASQFLGIAPSDHLDTAA